jgi:hypothetical protein
MIQHALAVAICKTICDAFSPAAVLQSLNMLLVERIQHVFTHHPHHIRRLNDSTKPIIIRIGASAT